MDISELTVDIAILGIAMFMALMLPKTWMRRTVIAMWGCLIAVCFAYYQKAAWLDSVPSALVDCATFGLAALGGYVAVNPPSQDDKKLKYIYMFSFITLAIFGIGANVWQRGIESGRRVQSEHNETTARNDFSKNLKAVKESTEQAVADIRNFLTHPPKGYTPEQVLQIAKTLLDNHAPAARLERPSNIITPVPKPVIPKPLISSVPTIFTDGEVKGKNFGAQAGMLQLHVRVKPSAQRGDYASDGRIGPDNLQGNLRGVNYIDLPIDIIQRWSDTAITLKFPSDYWQNAIRNIESRAQSRGVIPPQQSDLEVGYQILSDSGDARTGFFYAH
ncbi:MAG: hypothetical protein JWQ87_364 [Candidatus Sulfotelmatobacter sp.]|nr:hypothetical protein [Candidatus Sulfotelmatobacter sp.]